jgi:hypothetical protein
MKRGTKKSSIARQESGLLGYIRAIASLKQTVCANLVVIGGLLNEIKANELYKEQFETFEEFLGSPEVSMGRATAFKAMAINAFLVEQKIKAEDVADIDPDKIYRVIRAAKKQGLGEWLEKARALSRSDLANEVREAVGLPPHDPAKTAREYVKEFLYVYCPENNMEPGDYELEDLLMEYDKWRKE